MTELLENNKSRQQLISFERLFGIILILFIGLIFFNSDWFSLKQIEVRGTRRISNTEIILSAGLKLNQNIFQVDSRRIKKMLMSNPRVADVKIQRQLPGKILITVRERTPLCLLLYQNNLVIVSNDCIVIGLKGNGDEERLPLITGVKLKSIKIGEEITDIRVGNGIQILKLADPSIRQTISEINLEKYRLYVNLPKNPQTVEVNLGNPDDLPKKLFNLKAIFTTLSPGNLVRIDLRTPDLPTIVKSGLQKH